MKATGSHQWKFAATVLFAFAGAVSFTPPVSAEEPADPAALEKPVKDFALKDIVSGKTTKLSDQKGKVVVLIWHSPACGACPAYDGRIKEFVEQYVKNDAKPEANTDNGDGNKADAKRANVVVLGINSNSTDLPDDVRDYVTQHELNFPMLRDEDASVAAYFGIEQTATFLVIDDKGVLRYRGGFDDNPAADLVKRHYVKDAVDAILAGKKFLLRETLSFG